MEVRPFPGGLVVKNPPCNAGETGSIPAQGTKTPTCHAESKPMRLLESLCAVMKKTPHDTEKIPHATTKTLCGKINK